mgnify:FL=1
MIILDDYLNIEDFNHIRNYLKSDRVNWSKVPKVLGDDSEYNYQYTFMVYNDLVPYSPLFNTLFCIFRKLNIVALTRIKVNKEPLYPERHYGSYHYDWNSPRGTHENPIGLPHMKTGILYLNTCDGYTEFEDGKIVKSVANRFVEFPSNILHRGVSQTDTEWRTVINFNYFTAD